MSEIDAQLTADVAELRAAVFGNLMRQEPGMVKDCLLYTSRCV